MKFPDILAELRLERLAVERVVGELRDLSGSGQSESQVLSSSADARGI